MKQRYWAVLDKYGVLCGNDNAIVWLSRSSARKTASIYRREFPHDGPYRVINVMIMEAK